MLDALMLSGALLLVAIGAVHVYWACGGRAGVHAALPVPEGSAAPLFTPGPLATSAVALAMLSAAGLLLVQGGFLVDTSPAFARWACTLGALVFLARAIGEGRYLGFSKRVRDSSFARLDTWLYSPLCVYLGAAFGAAAWRGFAA